jgi:N-glycosidase YbiA
MNRIAKFDGDYRFLSNFYLSIIEIDGATYHTVEHAYQAMKTLNRVERAKIRALPSPADAKRAGKRLTLRQDWERVKVPIMTLLVSEKFWTNERLADLLLETGDAELVEGNTWGDRFWGVSGGKGENHLGRILMFVRDQIRGNFVLNVR